MVRLPKGHENHFKEALLNPSFLFWKNVPHLLELLQEIYIYIYVYT
jgi:hypothetical protein